MWVVYLLGFDTYRGPSSVSNGNYSQLQFQAGEYPGTPYSQRVRLVVIVE